MASDSGDYLTKADQWLAAKNLNNFGDPEDTMYMGGSPLFDESTGVMTPRSEYLKNKYPDEPWLKPMPSASAGGTGVDSDLAAIDQWLEAKGFNKYGDPEDTMYMGGSPLFNEMTGESKPRIVHILEKFPAKPWESSTDDL